MKFDPLIDVTGWALKMNRFSISDLLRKLCALEAIKDAIEDAIKFTNQNLCHIRFSASEIHLEALHHWSIAKENAFIIRRWFVLRNMPIEWYELLKCTSRRVNLSHTRNFSDGFRGTYHSPKINREIVWNYEKLVTSDDFFQGGKR